MANSRPVSIRFNPLDDDVLNWLAHYHKDTIAGVVRRALRREMLSVDVKRMGKRGLALRAAYAGVTDVADVAADGTSTTEEVSNE
jgi:hypothetical protein